VTNAQVLDAMARWLRDNPAKGAAPGVLEARAGIYRRLREINSLVSQQEREAGNGPAGAKQRPGT
jgi:hypothetical protein